MGVASEESSNIFFHKELPFIHFYTTITSTIKGCMTILSQSEIPIIGCHNQDSLLKIKNVKTGIR